MKKLETSGAECALKSFHSSERPFGVELKARAVRERVRKRLEV